MSNRSVITGAIDMIERQDLCHWSDAHDQVTLAALREFRSNWRDPDPGQQWKMGDEFLPFHPQASHVEPAYRDGWNRCYWMAVASGVGVPSGQQDGGAMWDRFIASIERRDGVGYNNLIRSAAAFRKLFIEANTGVMVDAVAQERERCARIADDEARIREEAGRKHPEDSPARDRCFAAARAATNVAKGIRNGEVVDGVAIPFNGQEN